ncbi:hypothetical protein [Serratia marcescens]|uniref:hypothetical protein n=1 Tax=Serratia marcescens TaxID=615 RepID=UPI0010575D80|nr:hypothetical protein [Serratia marcescens]
MKAIAFIIISLSTSAAIAEEGNERMGFAGAAETNAIVMVPGFVDVKRLPDGRFSFQVVKVPVDISPPCDGSRWFGSEGLGVGNAKNGPAVPVSGTPRTTPRYGSCSADIWEVISEGTTYITTTNITGYTYGGIAHSSNAGFGTYLTGQSGYRTAPPGAQCDLSASISFDHGTVSTNSSDQKTVSVETDCTIAASVTLVLQAGQLDFGGGTKSTLTLPNGQSRMSMSLPAGKGSVSVTSKLNTGANASGPEERSTILYLVFN